MIIFLGLCLIIFFFYIHLLKKSLFVIYLWQLKEYRIDRFIAHLKTPEGNLMFKNFFLYLKTLLLFSFFYFFERKTNWADSLLFYGMLIIYFFQFILILKSVLRHKFFRPIFTSKVWVFVILFLFFSLIPLFAWKLLGTIFVTGFFLVIFLIVDLIMPIYITFWVIILQPLSYLIKKRYIQLAREKILNNKNLKVVGVTGSYGKTTTKEYLYLLLCLKYKVLKTPKNVNTEIGVAKVIMEQLTDEHEVFIVEMGAYKRGEIKALCELTLPQMGIITGIGNQHLALYGSMNKVVATKFELIDSLPEYGVAVLNSSNRYITKNLDKVVCQKLLFSSDEKADVWADKIKVHQPYILFDLHYKQKKETLSFHSLGTYNVSNLLAAITAAMEFDVDIYSIKNSLEQIHPLGRTMKPYPALNGSIVIDDTYNANTDGVILATRYLSHSKAKKILVISEVLELGKNAVSDHIKIGEVASQNCDYIFITGKNYAKYIKEGLLRKKFADEKIFIVQDYKKLEKNLKKIIKKDDMILLEGRGPEILLPFLKA